MGMVLVLRSPPLILAVQFNNPRVAEIVLRLSSADIPIVRFLFTPRQTASVRLAAIVVAATLYQHMFHLC